MGWDSDHILFDIVRGKILKDRYAGCCYGYNTSLSPIIINHRGVVTAKEKAKITALFPNFIRVEFQPYPDEFIGEEVIISVAGATRKHPLEVKLSSTADSAVVDIASSLIIISTILSQIGGVLERMEKVPPDLQKLHIEKE